AVTGNVGYGRDGADATTINKYLYIYRNAHVGGNFSVRRNFKVNGDSIMRGGLEIEDDLRVYKNQYVYGTSYVKGNGTFNRNLKVRGNSIVKGDSTVKGNLSVDGDLTIDGVNVKDKMEKNEKDIAAESHRRAVADVALGYEIGANRVSINKLANEVEKQEKAIAANSSAIKHLDKKVNKGTSMLVAMSNVDFQNVNAGEVAVGAGVGHYVGDQAVAVGVAYGVNDDLKVHAKWSGVAGDPHYNAVGGGVTYKFRTR
ncbi:MAG TPA: YadA C-terminal domain-containing protein, partial [Fusobacterium sp.]|uniref:YadA C-terminal domain-containing protein n=1 Tax=Fusobacterium sp. TaxID=68766 RepID=UPI002F410FEF